MILAIRRSSCGAGTDPSKVKHDGKEDDVDAIGNRKIGARGLGTGTR